MSAPAYDPFVAPREVDPEPYCQRSDRYVVSLIVSYSEEDGVMSPQAAAAHALDLTRDGGREGTVWHVYDRATRRMYRLEQHEFEGFEGFDPDEDSETEEELNS